MHLDETCHAFAVSSICYRVVSQFPDIVIRAIGRVLGPLNDTRSQGIAKRFL